MSLKVRELTVQLRNVTEGEGIDCAAKECHCEGEGIDCAAKECPCEGEGIDCAAKECH